MASAEELKEPPPPQIGAAPPRPPAAALGSPYLARYAFVILAALISASWFIEPFAAAAAELRVPWPSVVATAVLFAALFYASVHLFGSFFRPHPPPATAAAGEQGSWERVGAIAVAVAAVGVAIAACLVAAGGSAYGYAPARS